MKPDRKVTAGALAGALVVILVWLLQALKPGLTVSAEVALALNTVLVFVVQYFVPNAPDTGGSNGGQLGFARPQLLVALFLGMFPLALLPSCATTPADVLAVACDRSSNYSVERCAKGIGETWEVYQKRAAELVADPTTPADVKRAIQTAEAASRPVVVEVLRTGAVVAQIRADLAAGASADDKLAIASARLDEHIALALPRVRGMREALGL